MAVSSAMRTRIREELAAEGTSLTEGGRGEEAILRFSPGNAKSSQNSDSGRGGGRERVDFFGGDVPKAQGRNPNSRRSM